MNVERQATGQVHAETEDGATVEDATQIGEAKQESATNVDAKDISREIAAKEVPAQEGPMTHEDAAAIDQDATTEVHQAEVTEVTRRTNTLPKELRRGLQEETDVEDRTLQAAKTQGDRFQQVLTHVREPRLAAEETEAEAKARIRIKKDRKTAEADRPAPTLRKDTHAPTLRTRDSEVSQK